MNGPELLIRHAPVVITPSLLLWWWLPNQAVGMMDGQELHTFCSSGDMHEKHTSLFPFRQVGLYSELLKLPRKYRFGG